MTHRSLDITVAITGAGNGIGAAIARALASAGARVGVADINEEAATRVADGIRQAGGEALSLQMDVADRASVAAGLTRLVDTFGDLGVMFNNAGISKEIPFLEQTELDWERTHKVNVIGTLICTQEAAKLMIAAGHGGKIVNTTSITARNANAPFAHYAASKAAVSSLIQSSARALAPHDITVTGFAPGVVATEIWEQVTPDPEERAKKIADYSSRILRGRVASPDDIVPVALFLAGPGSDYMTGQIITIDGGMVL